MKTEEIVLACPWVNLETLHSLRHNISKLGQNRAEHSHDLSQTTVSFANP